MKKISLLLFCTCLLAIANIVVAQSGNVLVLKDRGVTIKSFTKDNYIEFEFSTYLPPLDPNAQVFVICNPEGGNVVGVNKPTWRIYNYNFDLTVLEERYNVLSFTSGNAGLLYAR